MLSTFRKLALIGLCCASFGCTTIMDASTSKPIQPDPSERTFGTYIDDERLETIAEVNLRKAGPALKNAHINVNAYNRVLLLTGEVSSAEARALATETLKRIPKVRQVFNELQIQGNSSLLDRTNDTWLTSKVKAKLIAQKDVDSSKVKVVTEDGVVFLMGIVSQAYANKVANLVSQVGGVQKVVRTFEYVN